MARILKKIPNFKLPKYKMRDIEDIEELNIEYTPEVIEGLKKRIPNRQAATRERNTRLSKRYS